MKNRKVLIQVALYLMAALISIFIVSKYAASPESHQKTIQALDEKKTTVMELAAAKLILFGLAIYLVIPASVKVSDMIETSYKASIEETIDSAKEAAELAESDAEATEDETEKKGFFGGLISNVQNSVSDATDKVESVLNRFIEALAVLLVTSCVIPILVLVFFVWVIKMVMNTMSVSGGLTAGEW